MLNYFHVELFSCCTFFVLHFFHVALFSCWTFFMLPFFRVVPFSCCTFLCIALLSCCTSSRVASRCTLLMLHFLVFRPTAFLKKDSITGVFLWKSHNILLLQRMIGLIFIRGIGAVGSRHKEAISHHSTAGSRHSKINQSSDQWLVEKGIGCGNTNRSLK